MKRGVTRDGDDAGVNCVGMDVSTLGGYFEILQQRFLAHYIHRQIFEVDYQRDLLSAVCIYSAFGRPVRETERLLVLYVLYIQTEI